MAAGPEPAARRRVQRGWHLTLEQDAVAALRRVQLGRRRHQRRGVGVIGPVENRLGWPGFDDPTEVHHRHPVGDVPHHRQVVGDEDVGDLQLLLQLVEQVEHLRLHGQVQRRHGFVADDHVGVERERPRDADALPLPAGELLRVLVCGLGAEPDQVEQPPHPHVAVAFGLVKRLVRAPRLGDDVAGRHPRVQRGVGILEHHLHPPPELEQVLAAQAERVDAVEADRAGIRPLEHHQGAGQRGLATTGFTDQPEGLTAGQVEVDAVQRTQLLAAAAGHSEGLGQVADGQQLIRHAFCSPSAQTWETSPGKWHADFRRAPTVSRVGRVVRQISRASGQRAW